MDRQWLQEWKETNDHDGRAPFSVFAVGAAHQATEGWENWTEALDPEWKEAIEQDDQERIRELCDRDGIAYPDESNELDDPRLEKYEELFSSN